MTLINILVFLAFSLLFIRVIILIKIDSHRGKNTFIKFLFGSYAFQAMVPTLRKASSVKEASLIKASNVCLVFIYVLFITVLLIVVFQYDDLTKPATNETEIYLGLMNKKYFR